MLSRYLSYFDELVHNIYNMTESQENMVSLKQVFSDLQKKQVRLQTMQPIKSVGEYRLILIEHFFLIVMNQEDCGLKSLIISVNIRLVHIVTKWILEHFGNNTLMSKFQLFLRHCHQFGFEKFFLDIFVKLNFVSTMYDIFDQICKNDVVVDSSRAED